jgi:hypothetical protein
LGTIKYVDGNWAGAESGTAAEPYDTIAEGLADLTDTAGDSLYVKGGQTYNESNLTVGAAGASAAEPTFITVWPNSGVVTIDGDYGGHPADNNGFVVTANKDFITFYGGASGDDILIRDFERAAIYAVTTNTNESTYITIDDLTFDGNNTDAGFQGSIRMEYCDFLTFKNNTILSSSVYGFHAKYSDGNAGTDCLIDNNTITGVALSGSAYGIFWDSAAYCMISNNTIYFAVTAGEFRAIEVTDDDTNNLTTNIHTEDNLCYSSNAPAYYNNSNGITYEGVHTSTITGNTCYNWGEWGIDVGGGGGPSESLNVVVARNLCYNNVIGNIETSGDAGEGGNPIIVRNNVSYANDAGVDASQQGYGHHDGDANENGEIEWYNNTHWTNLTGRQGFRVGQCSTATLKNNISQTLDDYGLNLYEDDITDAGATLVCDYNTWYVGSGNVVRWLNNGGADLYTSAQVADGTLFAAKGIDGNSLGGDPLYVSEPSDLSIPSGSPCVNTGVTIGTFSDDYNEDNRPKGAAWDMGAYEYGGVQSANMGTVSGTWTGE